LKGLKVGHDLSAVADVGQSVILTLEDTQILKDGKALNDDEDRLINLDLKGTL